MSSDVNSGHCSRLSCIEFLFIGNWGQISKFCLSSLPVVEDLDIFCDILHCLLSGPVALLIDKSCFRVPQKLSIGALS